MTHALSEPAQKPSSAAASVRAYPSPAATALLALLAGVLAVVLKMEGGQWATDQGASARMFQGLWFFPTGAWCAVWLVQRTRWGRPSSPWGGIAVALLSYLLIAVVAILPYNFLDLPAMAGRTASALEAVGISLVASFFPAVFFSNYQLMATDSPAAFVAFGVGFMVLSLAGAWWRLPALTGPACSRGGAALVALSVAAYVLWIGTSFADKRSEALANTERWQLERIGLLVDASDGALESARAAAHAQRGAEALDAWLGRQPTKTVYKVTAQGQGDFKTLGAALAHLRRVLDAHVPRSFVEEVNARGGPFFTLEVGAGTYEGPLDLVGPVQIRPQAPGVRVVLRSSTPDKAVVDLSGHSNFAHGPALVGMTVVGAAERDAVNVYSSSALIQGNAIEGAQGQCGLYGRGVVRGNRFKGGCGVRLTGESQVVDNHFAEVTGMSLVLESNAKVEVRGNRYFSASAGPLILARDDASAEVEERGLRLMSDRGMATVHMEGNARLNLRSSALSNPGAPCVWMASGTPTVEVQGTRFEGCGNVGFPAVQADSGGALTIRASQFVALRERSTLQALVIADRGARLVLEGSSVE